MRVLVGARSSPLSRAQVSEVVKELSLFHPEVDLEPIFADSPGDRDKKKSLRDLGKCDFFTRDLDEMLLKGKIRVAIHSAKDLPEPIPEGLVLVALTKGVDPRDVLVFQEPLKKGARIATSSARREEMVRKMRPDFTFCDLRGTISERLSLLEKKEVDGVVLAEAALIRLALTHLNRVYLDGESASLQGRLAIIARSGDEEMKELFQCIHFRNVLYLGIDPKEGTFHYPVIRVEKLESPELHLALSSQFTHFIFTSKNGIRFWEGDLKNKTVIAVGEKTAEEARRRGAKTLTAKEECQEGVAKLIETLDLKSANLIYIRSKKARPFLEEFLREKNIPITVLDLYEPIFQTPKPIPDLNEFDEIMFTSPSTVEGFSKIFSQIPKRISLKTIGPITQKTLEEYSFARI